jgi:hypothetical protein
MSGCSNSPDNNPTNRLLAARKFGLEEVPVIVLDHLTEEAGLHHRRQPARVERRVG